MYIFRGALAALIPVPPMTSSAPRESGADNAAVVAAIYSAVISLEVGGNLGVSFEKARLEEVDVRLGNLTVPIAQSGMGCMGIAGCVWDCAYFNIDYLAHLCDSGFDFGNVICDLATGTGVVGMAYTLLNKAHKNVQTHIVFTDKSLTSCYYDNIETMTDILESGENRTTTCSVEYDWLDREYPDEMQRHFSTILCSDVIYEPAATEALLVLLRRVSFDRMFLVYKRRNDLKEKFFFEELVQFCDISLAVPPVNDLSSDIDFPLRNISNSEAVGMCVVLITPRPAILA